MSYWANAKELVSLIVVEILPQSTVWALAVADRSRITASIGVVGERSINMVVSRRDRWTRNLLLYRCADLTEREPRVCYRIVNLMQAHGRQVGEHPTSPEIE